MSFEDELSAFDVYASALPNNCVFLVDTYDTLQGVKHACQIGHKLREQGHRLLGIRLDSGDLSYLSSQARKILDSQGFADAEIVASNDLDENVIESLKHQGAQITVWGVGTRLATAFDQPALGGVYKMGALQDPAGRWQSKIKLSEQAAKTSIPGKLQVRRFTLAGQFVADMIFSEWMGEAMESRVICDPNDPSRQRAIEDGARGEDLLRTLCVAGKIVGQAETLDVVRSRVSGQLQQLHASHRRLLNPHEYPVGLAQNLSRERQQAIAAARV